MFVAGFLSYHMYLYHFSFHIPSLICRDSTIDWQPYKGAVTPNLDSAYAGRFCQSTEWVVCCCHFPLKGIARICRIVERDCTQIFSLLMDKQYYPAIAITSMTLSVSVIVVGHCCFQHESICSQQRSWNWGFWKKINWRRLTVHKLLILLGTLVGLGDVSPVGDRRLL